MTTISVKQARDIDHANAYTVTTDNETYTIWTNDNGRGLWINGRQIEGTSQFDAGRHPDSAIRHYFATNR